MRYTKFIIKNFRGIQELTLDLEKQPTSKIITLVGLNESGKTSILHAINLLQHDLPKDDRHKLIPKKNKLNFSGTVSIQGFLIVTDSDNTLISKKVKEWGIDSIKPIKEIIIKREYKYKDSQFIEGNNYWTLPIHIKKTGTTEFISPDAEDEDWQKIVAFLRDDLIPKILHYSDFLFDFPTKIYLDKETSEIKKQSQFRDVIQDILTSIDKDMTIEDHIIKRLKDKSDASQESLDHTLSKMSSQISKVVLGAWKNIMNIEGKEIFVEAKTETQSVVKKNTEGKLIPQQQAVHYLEFRLKEGTEKYYISERSLGFKWFFTFLLFTEFRKNRKTDIGETLFLLDEPASNLHSTAQKKLLGKFSELVHNSRLIYTTHSHHLINPHWLNGTYIVKNQAINYKSGFDFDTNETNIKATIYKQFVSANPTQQDYFQPILDSLEHQPGLLEKIPDIVLTEGKFDYYILKYVNEIVLNYKFKQLHFYPGNGADGNDQVIKLYMAWGRNFKILLDGDKGGEKAKNRYLKIFGKEISDQIITYIDLDKGWNFPIERIFTDEERLKITQMFDSTSKVFDKSRFNTSIQNLYSTKTKITLDPKTIKIFETIYTKLK
ncbi:MAG: DNA replication and repair protein RecF [Flavobacteriales bacterium]|nr:DNA replication and repair protein RecF [Flavobacteriales bacterium]